ncbi:5-deoxy-glucuronate isomerase [Cohnella sp. CIP 111063]|uniref:5-deoxy-glucuronate isomerase n=1 Tax=unclassified Cohnella TaxID=2636738 RepID=UPI000B8C0537|nr:MULTISPECIES: 5-deoxy-glucuronate isomerase [unclassified Cohnella]OXS54670.1 5-deoxy-glucuronate isomerase [Cohnella sp. CIP 111063]PRX64501.1 5-deoxyglucuronate isomerase [Cohnella sp. SGD-V74]
MSKLIVKPRPAPDDEGNVLRITPESAGWAHVGFEVYRLEPGATLRRATEEREACLVLLGGVADVTTSSGSQWQRIGRRMSVFEKIPPFSVYVPSGDEFTLTARSELRLAVCWAPGMGSAEARLISPEQTAVEHRGEGVTARLIHHILPETEAADSLLVVEVFTPAGHWSSFPPHKHDRDALPDESLLEETYYYEVSPKQGFAVQRVYTDDRSLDETLAVNDGEVVLVPEGYHPVSAPPGYEVYYLNVMAGPRRTWRIANDPAHAWLVPGAPVGEGAIDEATKRNSGGIRRN